MYELIQAGERTYYIDCPSRIGIYKIDEEKVCLIDSGNDKDAGKKVLKILAERGWKPEMILNTHSHADHVGGNRVIQSGRAARRIAPGWIGFLWNIRRWNPLFIWRLPYKELKNKFLLAQESKAEELTEEVLPAGMRMMRIDGHSFSMTAFGTEDGIWFIADGVSGEKIIEKYHISFCMMWSNI